MVYYREWIQIKPVQETLTGQWAVRRSLNAEVLLVLLSCGVKNDIAALWLLRVALTPQSTSSQ